MDIKVIKGNLQKLVAINANEQPMTVDLALGLIGAYMLKMIAPDLREWPAMEDFLKYLQSKCFNGKRRSMITESSFSDCVLDIKTFLSTQPFEDKRGTLMSLELKVITEVNDNGYLSFNDRTFGAYASQERIDDRPANNYIVVDNANNAIENNNVEGPEERNVNTETPNAETNTEDNTTEEEQEKTATDSENVSLNDLKEFLLSTFQKYPSGIMQFPYFWQYKLSQDQYGRLKKILLDLHLQRHRGLLQKEPCGTGLGTVARAVALFISEWYKRESTSLRGDHCLTKLELSSDDSSRIWNGADFPTDYLHKEDANAREMRQTAMCALGGLPLQYVYQSDRFKQFVNGLFILQNKEEEITDEDIESIVDCFDDKNRVFKRSLKSGSCKEYLIKLADYLENGNKEDLPFAETDLENAPFSNFMRILQEGYDEALPNNFLQKEIRIWTYDFMEEDDESNRIESDFYVHIGFLKKNNVITTRDLSKLGIMLPPEASMFDTRLKITLKDGSSSITDEKRTYHKIGNQCDDFCGAFGSSLATSIDLFKTKDIALLIQCGDYRKEIHLFTIPSYLELYATNNGFLWTTKTNNAAQKVLFYDKSIYTPKNEDDLDIQTKSFEENNWGWIYLTEAINLKDSTGKEITIGLGKSELIMVDFKVKSLRKVMELSKDGCVECVIQDNDIREIPLLYFDDKKRPMLSCDGMKGNDLLKNYKIEFKTTCDHYYSEWTTNNVPPQGFLSIRITCRDESKKKRQRRLEVYFIPGTYPIVKRNLDNNYIYIKGEKVSVLDELLKEDLIQTDDEFNYKYKDSCDNLKLTSIRFRIGDDDNHIILKVYRAFNWTQILNNGKTIKHITNDGSEKPPVALILQKNIHLQVVNEEGYKDYSPCCQRYIDYFRDPKDLSFQKPRDKVSGFYIDDKSQSYQLYVYISCYNDNGKIRKIEKKNDDRGNEFVLLNVSDDYINEYILYYWSGEQGDEPIKLAPTQLGKKSYRFEMPSRLGGKAIVFQSLRDCSPNLYFRPFYHDVKWDNYVQRYDSVSIDYIIRCYLLAVEHNVYFGVFPAIRNLQKRDIFSKFIRSYAQLKNYSFSRKDEIDLTRLAKELSMDWYFADYRILYNNDKLHNERLRECMKTLMHTSPVAKAFQVRDNKLCKSLEKAYKKYKKDFDGCDNTNNRIELLNQFA